MTKSNQQYMSIILKVNMMTKDQSKAKLLSNKQRWKTKSVPANYQPNILIFTSNYLVGLLLTQQIHLLQLNKTNML